MGFDPTAASRAVNAAKRQIAAGLVDPNPGVARLFDAPSVMGSPPTVTLSSANAASSITGAAAVAASEPTFRFLSAHMGAITFSGTPMWLRDDLTTDANPGTVDVEVCSDADSLDFYVAPLGTTGLFRVSVDGHPAAIAPTGGMGSGGAFYRINVDFSGVSAPREFRFQGTGLRFYGLWQKSKYSVWTPKSPRGPRLLWIGDSYSESSGDTWQFTSIPRQVGTALGHKDIVNSSLGSTGFLNPGTSPRVPVGTRLAHDVLALSPAPSLIVLAVGHNDVAYNPGTGIVTKAQVTAAALDVLDRITGQFPRAKVVVVANFLAQGGPGQSSFDVRDALHDAYVASDAHLWIDPTGGSATHGYITGQGHVGGTTGSGNADVYVGSDAVHYTQVGYDYVSARILADFAVGLPL